MNHPGSGAYPGFTAVEAIRAKRDGHPLTDTQIDAMVAGYTTGTVAEEQMAALCMAIVLRGMTAREVARWTAAMLASGQRLDLSRVDRPTVDKHSTGGVGDKITLALTPLVAAGGLAVPQLAGRGLGHTGGTLDKLEAIPGFQVRLSAARLRRQLAEVGAVICAAGEELAPADRRLYALRDVTGTVESIPLIASSIMSKKIAEGTGALVLDVKVGSGAFMSTVDDARQLANTMVALGASHGVRTRALLTGMSTPLGYTVGNALEVAEAVEVLAGGGPPDVVALVLALAHEMFDVAEVAAGVDGLAAGNVGSPAGAARRDVDPERLLANGVAMDVWRALVRAQGGDPDAPLPRANEIETVTSSRAGFVSTVDAYRIGMLAWRLGAGRARKEDEVSPSAGVRLRKRPGDRVRAGDVLMELHADGPTRLDAAHGALDGAVLVADQPPRPEQLIIERVSDA